MKQIVKKTLVGIMLLMTAVSLTGCGNTKPVENEIANLDKTSRTPIEGYTTYKTSKNIAFDYPEQWVSLGQEDMPMFVAVDGTGTSVNMTSEQLTDSTTLSEYIELAKTKIKEQMKLEGEIHAEKVNLNGREACTLSYVAIDEENDITTNILQVAINVDNTMYILTTGALKEYFETQKNIMSNIANSFRVESES